MHDIPSREGDHLYQLKDGEKVDILKRATAERNPKKAIVANPQTAKAGTAQTQQQTAPGGNPSKQTPPPSATKPAANRLRLPQRRLPQTSPSAAAKGKAPEPPKPVMEDWYLVRNSAGRVGWVLLRMVDLDIPLEVAQYAEGQRIMGYFVLNTVQDGDKQVPQYLVLLNEPKDGLPWDFNQIRIFTWGRIRHRYETAYRERNLEGYSPRKDWPRRCSARKATCRPLPSARRPTTARWWTSPTNSMARSCAGCSHRKKRLRKNPGMQPLQTAHHTQKQAPAHSKRKHH